MRESQHCSRSKRRSATCPACHGAVATSRDARSRSHSVASTLCGACEHISWELSSSAHCLRLLGRWLLREDLQSPRRADEFPLAAWQSHRFRAAQQLAVQDQQNLCRRGASIWRGPPPCPRGVCRLESLSIPRSRPVQPAIACGRRNAHIGGKVRTAARLKQVFCTVQRSKDVPETFVSRQAFAHSFSALARSGASAQPQLAATFPSAGPSGTASAGTKPAAQGAVASDAAARGAACTTSGVASSPLAGTSASAAGNATTSSARCW